MAECCKKLNCPFSYGMFEKTYPVPGEVKQSTILFVGEYPGEEEEKIKKPFVGKSGELLRKLLKETGVSDFSMTNLVKCFPKDRKVDSKVIKICGEYLKEEILRCSPNVIVPLGKLVNSFFSGENRSITKVRGTVYFSPFYKVKVVPLIHPAAVFREAGYLDLIKQDLLRVKKEAKSKEMTKLDGSYIVLDNFDKFEDFRDRLKNVSEASFDLETESIDFINGAILGIGFSFAEKTGYYLPLKDKGHTFWSGAEFKEIFNFLKETFTRTNIEFSAHNGKFDIKFLNKIGIDVKNFTFDTMLAHHLLDETTPHDLKELANKYLDVCEYAKEIETYKEKNDFSSIPLDVLGRYCAIDCDCTFRLKKLFSKELEGKEKLKKLFNNLVMPFQEVIKETEYTGVKIEKTYLLELTNSYKAKVTDLEKLAKEKIGREINLSSPKQLCELFYDEYKLEPQKTEKGNNSIDEEALKIIFERGHEKAKEIAGILLEHRTKEKILNTFLEPMTGWMDKEGRVHSNFLLHGTRTGRLSSAAPNLQNIPNQLELRKMFIASEGHKFIISDFSQIELRILAKYSKDERLLEAFNKGLDVHSMTASILFNVPISKVTKEQRAVGKTVNFGVAYGQGPEALAAQLKISFAEAENYINNFFRRFNSIRRWMDLFIIDAKKKGFVENMFGRRRKLGGAFREEGKVKKGGFSLNDRQIINTPIQGSAGDLTSYSSVIIRKAMLEEKIKGVLVLTVHDELIYEIKEEDVEQGKQIIEYNMKHPFGNRNVLGVPLEVGIDVEDHWL